MRRAIRHGQCRRRLLAWKEGASGTTNARGTFGIVVAGRGEAIQGKQSGRNSAGAESTRTRAGESRIEQIAGVPGGDGSEERSSPSKGRWLRQP